MKPQRRLKVGDKIPDFWTRDIHGSEIDSREFTGNTLVVFLRYAGCPFCNLAIARLSKEYTLLKQNKCDVVAFVQSTESNIESNIIQRQELTPPFPIVSDQPQDIYKLFGVAPNIVKTAHYTAKNAAHWVDAAMRKGYQQANIDGSAFIVPAYFLVDKRGVVQIADYGASFYDDSVFTPIYEYLTFGAEL
ncbi:AhpC/TSA family protein [Candidatus Saccharibacteria bacterium]|nr:AhpC/TSA family protein [Candidatus Saccharibacteria bacterium]